MKAFKVKRGNETYYRVELPRQLCPEGKRRSVMGKTRAEALQKAHAEMERWERELNHDAPEKTVAEFLAEFSAYYRADGGVASSTLEDYRYHIESHIVPALGSGKLRDLDPRKVDEFMRSLNEKNLSPRTTQYTYSVLRRALQFAVDWKYIVGNPASSRMRAAKRRQVRELSKIRFLDRDESRRFLEAVRGDRYEALYVVAITTGMRQGEILGLHWPDIDFENSRLTISRALQRTKRRSDRRDPAVGWELGLPKTAGSRRTIELAPVTIKALLDHRERQRHQRLLAGSAWQEQRFVFTSRTGTPVDTSNMLHQFQRILKDAALPRIRFYDLRHTHASLLIAEGVHPKKIAERLGHASIKLTMDLYGHLFEGSDQECASRMQQLFGAPAQNASDSQKQKVIALPVRRKVE
jgi:integrase